MKDVQVLPDVRRVLRAAQVEAKALVELHELGLDCGDREPEEVCGTSYWPVGDSGVKIYVVTVNGLTTLSTWDERELL